MKSSDKQERGDNRKLRSAHGVPLRRSSRSSKKGGRPSEATLAEFIAGEFEELMFWLGQTLLQLLAHLFRCRRFVAFSE
jgi:hypothetical protein